MITTIPLDDNYLLIVIIQYSTYTYYLHIGSLMQGLTNLQTKRHGLHFKLKKNPGVVSQIPALVNLMGSKHYQQANLTHTRMLVLPTTGCQNNNHLKTSKHLLVVLQKFFVNQVIQKLPIISTYIKQLVNYCNKGSQASQVGSHGIEASNITVRLYDIISGSRTH